MNTIGFLTGKFIPLHKGHINFINNAATQVTTLYVVLSYDEKFIDTLPVKLKTVYSLPNRLRWLTDTFRNNKNIKITFVDESNMLPYPYGWEQWVQAVKKVIPEPDKVFSSETEYDTQFKKYFPNTEHIVSTRDEINISATQIRSDVYKHWEYLPSIVSKDFVKTVCVVGTESCGKTTLTKYLSDFFNTNHVEEYGRAFVEKELNCNETILQEADYLTIAYNHLLNIESSKQQANKVLFIDTNLSVTQYYLKMYLGINNKVLDTLAEQEHYDLVIFLEDDVPWVADGMRQLNERTIEDKNTLLKFLGNDIVKISGSYKERLDTSKLLVKNLIGK